MADEPMTHPMEAAARAMCDEWGYAWEHDADDDQTVAPDGEEVTYCPRPSQADFKRANRAAITAFLEAAEKDDAACAAIADAVDAEMARQTENAITIGRGPNYPRCGRVALAALKRIIAEEAP